MIALVTSTICPATNVHTYFNETERYSQTIKTIEALNKKGFDEIIILDNSAKIIEPAKLLIAGTTPISFFHSFQYTFPNKGFNEALLILNNLHNIRADQTLFKISGRYYPDNEFYITDIDFGFVDFIGLGENFEKKRGLVTTRGYFIKNKELLEKLLVFAIEDMLSYGKGIYGVKSAIKHIRSIGTMQTGAPFQLSIEQAFARVIKSHFKYQLLNKLNIEGYLAGSDHSELIKE